MQPLLEVKNLSVSFRDNSSSVEVVSSVSFSIEPGKTLAIVGESGCGKSVTASSIMGLLPRPYGTVTSGEVHFNDRELLSLPIDDMYQVRGGEIAMIFQEPMTAMNPVHVSGKQVREVLELHRSVLTRDLMDREVLKLLKDVEMPSPETRVKNYPFQLSGGMRQRMMIAMALAGEPKLLIADEPTTALDVTVQAQILRLIQALQKKNDMGVLFITHDMGVVAEVSDCVAVMYAGQVVEYGEVREIFYKPKHPYTKGLIESMPTLISTPKSRLPSISGSVPSPKDFPNYCRFYNRCPKAESRCRELIPELRTLSNGHRVRCILAGDGDEA